MADAFNYDKKDKQRFAQVAFEAGRKHGGAFNTKILTDLYKMQQVQINYNWDRMKRAWEAGANPKPLPKAKPRGLNLSSGGD